MQTVVTNLKGTAKALEFYEMAFRAAELTKKDNPDWKIVDASILAIVKPLHSLNVS